MTKVRTAIVIGGGIAGPVTALALRRAGIEATVYEGHRDSADGLGGWIALAPNGVAALEPIGAVLTGAHPVGRQSLEIGRRRVTMPVLDGAGPLQYLRRGSLHAVLRDLGAPTAYGKRLVSVRESPGSVTAFFDDGTSATADVLIGADGVHSTVRRLIDPAALPRRPGRSRGPCCRSRCGC